MIKNIKLVEFKDITKKIRNEELRNIAKEKLDLLSEDDRKLVFDILFSIHEDRKKPLNENQWWNTVGDILGIFDPTGVVDLVNALDYIRQGDYFFGILSMISIIPYVGDAIAKPLIGVGKTSKLMKGVDEALMMARKGDSLNAGLKLEEISKSSGLFASFIVSVPKWGTKLKDGINALPGQKITGGLRRVLNDWIDLFINVAKKRTGSKVAVGKVADKVAFAPLKADDAVKLIDELKKAVKTDAKIFKNFKPNDPSFMSKYFWPGFSFNILGRNRQLAGLMRRTKFYTGFLDFLGIGNFVGPEELGKKFNKNKLDQKFKEYTKTKGAQENWTEDFSDVHETKQNEPTKERSEEPSSTFDSGDIVGDIIKQVLF